MRNSTRLSRLEQKRTTTPATIGPGYVAALTVDELPAALAEYLKRWPDARLPVKAFLGGFSPDDWD